MNEHDPDVTDIAIDPPYDRCRIGLQDNKN
jgi:hypothetical protein